MYDNDLYNDELYLMCDNELYLIHDNEVYRICDNELYLMYDNELFLIYDNEVTLVDVDGLLGAGASREKGRGVIIIYIHTV